VTLSLLRRQAANVADQEGISLDTQLAADALTLSLEHPLNGRLDAVVDASDASRVAYAASDGEPSDVVRDGDDQILSRRNQVMDDADERVEKEAVVIVARRHQKRPPFAHTPHSQASVDVGTKQVRVHDVEPTVPQQRHQAAERARVEAAPRVEQMHWYACLPKDGHELAFAHQHGHFVLECLVVSVRQQRQQVILGAAAVEGGDQLQDAYGPYWSAVLVLLRQSRLHVWRYSTDANAPRFTRLAALPRLPRNA
jgi:hypothetical protein